MKKILFLIIIVIVVVVLLGGFLYFRMSESERYALKLNFMNENALRNEVKKSMYYEFNAEECILNNYQKFASLEKCQQAINCLSEEVGSIIPKEDLKSLAKVMDDGRHAEAALSDYLGNKAGLNSALEIKANYCLAEVGATQ